jgi:hypothetical protein
MDAPFCKVFSTVFRRGKSQFYIPASCAANAAGLDENPLTTPYSGNGLLAQNNLLV